MVWGRVQRASKAEKDGQTPWTMPRAASTVAVFGAFVCVLFLCGAANGWREEAAYPAEVSRAAVQTFLTEHTAFADAIGLNAYFPDTAVSVGAFPSRGEEAYRAYVQEGQKEWTFRDYLADAFRALFGRS